MVAIALLRFVNLLHWACMFSKCPHCKSRSRSSFYCKSCGIRKELGNAYRLPHHKSYSWVGWLATVILAGLIIMLLSGQLWAIWALGAYGILLFSAYGHPGGLVILIAYLCALPFLIHNF